MRKTIGLALVLLSATLARPGELSSETKTEIDSLLDRLGTSECRFYRNGTWYGSSDAKKHLQLKLDHVTKKKVIGSSEEFIEEAATKSNASGQPYKVRCPNQPEQPSAVWFRNELEKLRKTPSK